MHRLITISMIILLASCSGKISSLKYSTEKVSDAVSTCTEAAKKVCSKLDNIATKENTDTNIQAVQDKSSISWDAHMMLW